MSFLCCYNKNTKTPEMPCHKKQKLQISKFAELPDDVIFHIYKYASSNYGYLPLRFSLSVCRLNKQVFSQGPLMAAGERMLEEYADLCEEEMHRIQGGKRPLKPNKGRIVYTMFPSRRPRGFCFPF